MWDETTGRRSLTRCLNIGITRNLNSMPCKAVCQQADSFLTLTWCKVEVSSFTKEIPAIVMSNHAAQAVNIQTEMWHKVVLSITVLHLKVKREAGKILVKVWQNFFYQLKRAKGQLMVGKSLNPMVKNRTKQKKSTYEQARTLHHMSSKLDIANCLLAEPGLWKGLLP